jgi:hypothetical protein
MKAFLMTQFISSLAVIEAAGVPALRVVFTLAVIGFAGIGLYIYRRRHQLFDRDPDVDNDVAAARHVRFENIIFVWGAMTIVLFCICIAAWRA